MSSAPSSSPDRLERLRYELDRVDAELLEVLNRRARLVSEAFRHKSASGNALYDGPRVLQILTGALDRNSGPLSRSEAARLLSHVLDFFGLEYAADPGARRGRVRAPVVLQSVARPWIIGDLSEAEAPDALPRAVLDDLVASGVRLIRRSHSDVGRERGLLRIGCDGEADIREAHLGQPTPRSPGAAALMFSLPGEGTLGARLRAAHEGALHAGVESVLLLVQPDAETDLLGILDRTDHPVIVDGRGRLLESALAALGQGADGLLISCTTKRPADCAEAAARAGRAPTERRRPITYGGRSATDPPSST